MRRIGLAALAASLTAGSPALAVTLQPVARDLDSPWAMAILPNGRLIVTERGGSMRVVAPGGRPSAPLRNVPPVVARGQGGLLDVIADSAFARNRTLYFCFSEDGEGGNSTALARARLAADEQALEDVKVIFRQQPKVQSRAHFGCRIVEHPDGRLFLTLGDRFSRMQDAQTLDNHHGKVVRVEKDGRVPADNPFVGRAGALPEIWSYGHRNPQGAALDGAGRLWVTEHGPQGGDELNLIEPGRNYGWPVITYGENYGGGKIGEGITERAGMEQPVVQWTPSMAPSGLAWLPNDQYGDWQGSLFAGSLKFQQVERIALSPGAGRPVAGARQTLLKKELGRVRDVRVGPDGGLYVLSESEGRIVRLVPDRRR
jgi:glucose/arabinose dehydrogenase